MPILHSVFFYFKEDISSDVIEAQTKAIVTDLAKIEVVKWIKAGAPFGIDRDVVDNSYGTSLHLEVESKQDLDAYQTHPIHLNFVGQFKPNWTGIKVFDTKI
ncbi:Dabb family protein [bacterium]|nr:MAG: Dabb family protein [bacterium]